MTKLLKYRSEVFQEKLFVHTDRSAYLTGEVMWLKIYNVDASLHAPATVSKVAYIEIVDADNQSLVQEKIELRNGVGNGTLFIPATIGSGNYVLRAYTNWMKNFGPDYFFHKTITIVNSFVKLDSKSTAAANYDVQFFPEGGRLLAGAVNRVGFKGVGKNGKGMSFHGAIVDDSNDTLVRFQPMRFGMGSFEFTPVEGKRYSGVISVPNSPKVIVELPQVQTEGYSMRVFDGNESVTIEVSHRPLMTNGPLVRLLAHTRLQVITSEQKPVSNGKASFVIPKADLKEGVTHITIFDPYQGAVSERLYFKAPEKSIEMTLQSDRASYSTRTKVNVDLATDRAVPQMSVSVYKLDSLGENHPEHINDFLYLTSELRGTIESPAFYFSTEADAKAAADNLMLTQGWRKLNWKDVFKKSYTFEHVPEVHGHIVRGQVTDIGGKPTRSILTYASVAGKIVDVYSSRSNSKGEVFYEMKHFNGNTKLTTSTDSLYTVQLTNPFSKEKTAAQTPAFTLPASTENNLIERAVGMQVQNIYYPETFRLPKVDSASFYGVPDEVYYLDDYTRFPVMEEVMREYVRGVFVRKQKGNFKFYLLDIIRTEQFKDQPLMLVDGVPVFNVDKVMAYDPLKVKKIEIMTRKFYHGNATFFGIVSLSTYKGDLNGFELGSSYRTAEYPGIQIEREFYSPRHDSAKESDTRLPDQRSLIYWNGDLTTDATGKANMQFFTSDVPGTYQIVVEAITADGTCGFATQTFKVTK